MSLGPERVSGQDVLPEPVHGTLPGSLVAEAARGEGHSAADLPSEISYSAFEAGERRFAWIHGPATVEGEGVQFFGLDLNRSGNEWQIADIDRYDSPEDALQAAGRAWLKASGGPDVPSEPVADW